MKADEDEDEDTTINSGHYQCLPSLVALQQMRNRLHMAQNGKRLMKWSAMATRRELRKIAMEIVTAMEGFEIAAREAFILIARCRFYYPNLNVMVIENLEKQAIVTVDKSVKCITGVKILEYEVLETEMEPLVHLGIDHGGQCIRAAKQAWLDLLKRLVLILQLQTSFAQIDMNNRSSTKFGSKNQRILDLRDSKDNTPCKSKEKERCEEYRKIVPMNGSYKNTLKMNIISNVNNELIMFRDIALYKTVADHQISLTPKNLISGYKTGEFKTTVDFIVNLANTEKEDCFKYERSLNDIDEEDNQPNVNLFWPGLQCVLCMVVTGQTSSHKNNSASPLECCINKLRKITKVKRYKNSDGTIDEVRHTITIKSEKNRPFDSISDGTLSTGENIDGSNYVYSTENSIGTGDVSLNEESYIISIPLAEENKSGKTTLSDQRLGPVVKTSISHGASKLAQHYNIKNSLTTLNSVISPHTRPLHVLTPDIPKVMKPKLITNNADKKSVDSYHPKIHSKQIRINSKQKLKVIATEPTWKGTSLTLKGFDKFLNKNNTLAIILTRKDKKCSTIGNQVYTSHKTCKTVKSSSAESSSVSDTGTLICDSPGVVEKPFIIKENTSKVQAKENIPNDPSYYDYDEYIRNRTEAERLIRTFNEEFDASEESSFIKNTGTSPIRSGCGLPKPESKCISTSPGIPVNLSIETSSVSLCYSTSDCLGEESLNGASIKSSDDGRKTPAKPTKTDSYCSIRIVPKGSIRSAVLEDCKVISPKKAASPMSPMNDMNTHSTYNDDEKAKFNEILPEDISYQEIHTYCSTKRSKEKTKKDGNCSREESSSSKKSKNAGSVSSGASNSSNKAKAESCCSREASPDGKKTKKDEICSCKDEPTGKKKKGKDADCKKKTKDGTCTSKHCPFKKRNKIKTQDVGVSTFDRSPKKALTADVATEAIVGNEGLLCKVCRGCAKVEATTNTKPAARFDVRPISKLNRLGSKTHSDSELKCCDKVRMKMLEAEAAKAKSKKQSRTVRHVNLINWPYRHNCTCLN